MSERLKPSENQTNRVILVRNFARKTLTDEGEPDNFIKATVEFADAAFYTERGVGNPDDHIERATKKAEKLGLSAKDINRAIQTAQGIFAAYWQLSSGDSPVTLNVTAPEVIQRISEIERRVIEEQRQKRVQREKILIAKKFQRLMEYSDTEISILNANTRIDFASDPVYPKLNRDNKGKMRTRTLTEMEYEKEMVKILIQKDIIVFRADHTYDLSKLPVYIMNKIHKDWVLKERLGEEKFSKLVDYVRALAAGNRVSRAQMIQDGLQPEIVLAKARSTVSGFYIAEAERERLIYNPLPSASKSTRRGVDPQVYLDDGSHRHQLGYVQGQKEPKEN